MFGTAYPGLTAARMAYVVGRSAIGALRGSAIKKLQPGEIPQQGLRITQTVDQQQHLALPVQAMDDRAHRRFHVIGLGGNQQVADLPGILRAGSG